MSFFRFSLVTIAAAFAVFMTVSTTFLSFNLAASVVAGLMAVGGSTVVALSVSGREWRSSTGLSVFRADDVGLGALLGRPTRCRSVPGSASSR